MKINLKDPAVWAALERQAYDGTVELAPLSPAAYKYFSELAALYRAFRFEGMAREEAERRKQHLRREYGEQVSSLHYVREACTAYQEAIKRSEMLRAEIEKAQDIRTIADKACEAIALMTGELSFYERQKQKIWEENP